MREIISSLDIGTREIKIIVGEYLEDTFNVLCAEVLPSKGFKDYEITNENELIKTIKKLIDIVNQKLNIKLKKVIINIPTKETNFSINTAEEIIHGDENVVGSKDILKVIQKTTINQISINDELISAQPISFVVGDQETQSPYKKVGKTIKTKTVLVTADKRSVYDIINVVEKSGLEVIDISCAGLVDYYNFKNDYLDKQTGIIVNVGHFKTEVSVFTRGIFVNGEVLPVGGENIDNDISLIYNISKKEALYLKENLALASIRKANPKDTIEIKNKDQESITINQYELTEIVSSRINEILKLVKTSINHLTKKKISYIIITGGLTELKDFEISLESIFGESAQIGKIDNLGARDNKYSTPLGMIYHFKEKLRLRHREYSTLSENDIESMSDTNSKITLATDSILSRVFGYFFDN